MFTCWYNNGLAVYPKVNMVKNIGFGADSTHTAISRPFILKTGFEDMLFPLQHPSKIERNLQVDRVDFERWYRRTFGMKVFDAFPKIQIVDNSCLWEVAAGKIPYITRLVMEALAELQIAKLKFHTNSTLLIRRRCGA